MSDISDKFFAALLSSGDTSAYIQLGDVEAVFTHVQSDMEDFAVLNEYIKTYGKLPKLETFNNLSGKNLKPSTEDVPVYFDLLRQRHVKKTIIKTSQDANLVLQDDPVAALAKLEDMVRELTIQRLSPQLFDFRESHDILAHGLIEKRKPSYGIKFGWPTLDAKIGGARGGDLISFCGRLGQGKTMLLLYSAHHAWKTQKKVILFVSMEMTPELIFERLAATDQGIPQNWVKFSEFPTFRTNRKQEFLDKLKLLEDEELEPFYVVDGNLTASVNDVSMLTGHLAPHVVYVDGAYMLESDQGFKSHEKVGHVVSGLKKHIATANKIPVVASWQLSRKATELKGNKQAGTEHIAGSDDIPRLSSVVLELAQEETAETERVREIRLMKGRSGEKGKFNINWNFRKMDFTEIEPIQDNEIMTTRD